MVAKCANQECRAEFLRLILGKVFVGEVRPSPEAPRERRYAWLCDKCSDTMSVLFNKTTGEPFVFHTNVAA